ncbi:hypothetical protein [Trueperella pecoris]|uniref:hypothetical protein n=1 Tax=Trueperella pecoris TaxID=2733571 RepID=UPI001ABDA6A0|nr:hypothetical protein [Trueperella pecoris]QTG76265.1 hypothetical protein J4179_04300 [Trueperella pecoris]
MRIALISSALPGLGPLDVGALAAGAWREARPGDDVAVVPTSEGQPVAHIGTGLEDVVRFRAEAADTIDVPGGRRYVVAGARAVIDLAEIMAWDGRGEPIGSTAFLASDISMLIDRGVTDLHLHLPQLMKPTDLGLGLLGGLAGQEVSFDDEPGDLGQILHDARSAVRGLSLTATYAAGLPLLGVDGMARRWAALGYEAARAQEIEKKAGAWVHEFERAARHSTRRSLLAGGSDADSRAGYAGPGGGLGMTASLLGATTRLIGDILVASCVGEEADLIVYVCDSIGVDLPSGLHAAVRCGQELGVPVVLLTDSAGMRKGEMPRLGLNGAYELRPQRAFLDEDDDPASLTLLPQLLTQATRKVATTWGWDG